MRLLLLIAGILYRGQNLIVQIHSILCCHSTICVVLEHAGFAAEDVQWLRTEFEMDDRVPQYEVQFRQGGLAYEYEIHGETGEILSMDVDD